MRRISVVLVLLVVSSFQGAYAQEEETQSECLEATRPHLSRCDQYFQCKVYEDGSHAWVATQCRKGLVYMQNLGTCVVPDSDWECDLSAENERDHSDENIYGIDNLSDDTRPSTYGDLGIEQSRHSAQLSDLSLEMNDIESSGDGSLEHLDEPKVKFGKKPTSTSATKSPVGILSQQQLDQFLAFYDTNSDPKRKTKPPQSFDEEKHLEHLKEIVRQQNQLNRVGNKFKDATFSWPKPDTSTHDRTEQEESKTEAPKDRAPVNIPPGMEDIIRSILQISQQAIANQKSTPVAPPVEPVVKPVFIPISLNPIQSSSASPPSQVASVTDVEMKTNPTATNNRPPPVGPTADGSFNVDRNTMYNDFRPPPTNSSIVYSNPQQVFYDAYGNRFMPKDPYGMAPLNGPNYGYNSFNAFNDPSQLVGGPQPSNNWSPYGVTQPPAVQNAPNLMMYQQYPPKPASIPMHTLDPYDKLNDVIDRIDQMATGESKEDDKNVSENGTEEDDNFDQNSDEHGMMGASSSKLKRKLFTLGDTTFDYDLYKDSMLPLVEANPNDDRISVVTCMVGSRQPNRTDCFRYYICNPHNGMFQSYTCPTFTAFNKHSRMCDMASYKPCKTKSATPALERLSLKTKSSSHASQLKSELRLVQQYVELIRQESEKLRQQGSLSSQSQPTQKIIFVPSMGLTDAASSALMKTRRKPSAGALGKRKSNVGAKRIPTIPATKKPKPTIPRCRLEGRMPDPTDDTTYYVCHRKSPKKFIKLKMACPGSLIYCAATQYCTLPANC